MTRTDAHRRLCIAIGVSTLALLVLPVLLPMNRSVEASAQITASAQIASGEASAVHYGPSFEDVTYTRDIAGILQENCVACHQPGSIAPMSLTSYNLVRRYGPKIKEKVSSRIMPPWHIDHTVGIQEFKNDRSLTEGEIDAIVAWVDGGMPMGDEADLPEFVDPPDVGGWQFGGDLGEPDLVVRSDPYTLAAQTQDKWFRPESETGLTEERWVKAIEIRPSYPDGKRIVHHALAFLLQDESEDVMSEASVEVAGGTRSAMGSPGLFMEWAVGKAGEIFPDGAGKLMLPGSKIRWEIHMHAMGREVEDSYVELGVWFYDEDEVPENRTRLRMFDARGPTGLDIDPGEIAMTQDFHVLRYPSRLENFQPHMHMRGKAMSMEAIYPDGRREMLSQVSNFQWNWHVNYIYADDAAPLLPAGTTLAITAWHDNTEDNPNNPDHRQWVGWGDRTVDEMAHAWVDVTYLEPEEFDRLTAERKARAASENEPPPGSD